MNTLDPIARYYDAIYYKDDVYASESHLIIEFIDHYKLSRNMKLLDIACGTGTHLKFFVPRFQVSGLDVSPDMLSVARERHPGITFYQADMTDFNLDEKFGAIICLYGSIGFVQTKENLCKTLESFSRHLDEGGVLILTPWSTLEGFRDTIATDNVTTPDLQIVRMEKVSRNNNMVDITYHYLIGENNEVTHYTGHHAPIRLFSLEEYEASIKQSGLEIVELYRGDNVQMGMAWICRKQLA